MLPYGYANTQQLPYPGQPSYPQNPAALQQTNGEAQMQAVRKRKEHELGPDGKPKDRRFDHCNLVLEATGRRGALYIGDILSSVIPEILEPANIRAILSVGHDAAWNQKDTPYRKVEANKSILCEDVPGYDMTQHFDEAIAFIEEQLNAGRNLLIHCHAGVSRSATITIAYLMTKNQWTYDEALEFLKSKRKWVRPNFGFEKQLRDYEQRLNAMRRSRVSSLNGSVPPQLRTSASTPSLPLSNLLAGGEMMAPNNMQVSAVQQPVLPNFGGNMVGGPLPLQQPDPAKTHRSNFPLSNHLTNNGVPATYPHPSLNGSIDAAKQIPTGYQNGFVRKQRTVGLSEAANIKTSLWTDVGSICSFADADEFEFGGRPPTSNVQFSNARKALWQPTLRPL